MRRRVEQALHAMWYGSQTPPWPLRLLSSVYGRGIKPSRPVGRPPLPVIVVGGLVAGGGGKTPTVIALVKALKAQGWRVSVISRGYGRRGRDLKSVQAGDDPRSAGDEPVLIAEQTGAEVWVCADRCRALQAAVEAGAEVVVSDDGLQHQALPRSFECCIVDGQRGIGNGWLLPAGPLRQPLSRLRTVDQILIQGGDVETMAQSLHVAEGRCYGLHRQARGIRRLGSEACEAKNALTGKSVTLMTGIADPDGFADSLKAMGLHVATQRRFADHHCYRPEDLQGLSGPVVVTEKDAVKLKQINVNADLLVLMSEMVLPDAMVKQVVDHVRNFRLEGAGHG